MKLINVSEMKREISMTGKAWGFISILLIFSGNTAAGVPEGVFSHNYDIGTLTSTPYENVFSGETNLLTHSYTFDLDAPATVEARVANARMETGFLGGFPPLTHTLYDISLYDSGNHKLYEGTTTQSWSFGSTLEAVVTGELPAGKDYFVNIIGTQTNDTALSYATKISVIPAVPEPETYAMLLAGLGLMGFVVRHRKQNI
jgi:hypothetical protein